MNIIKYETNLKSKKFLKPLIFSNCFKDLNNIENNLIILYPKIKYQEIIGFGGAFTESAGYCFSKLDSTYKAKLTKEYFDKNGACYNLCRLPIGSCDFALSSYSHSNIESLSDFSIKRDQQYIIPMIKEALKINPNLKLIATPWSPPAFMKSNKDLKNGGKLINDAKSLWANYLVKFIKSYLAEGINIDFITIQNEPNASQPWESCTYTAEEEKEMIIKYIAPAFKFANINTKILIWDHNKERIFSRATEIFQDKIANEIIAGIGYHYYSGDHFENIELVRNTYKDKLIIHTEGCTGYEKSWLKKRRRMVPNAEIYAHDIIGDLNAGSNGYIDWNMLLDFKGGPTHIENSCNAPIMLNKKANNYDKTLSYYYINHFSRFIKPGSRKIAFSVYSNDLEVTSFYNIDNTVSVIILNRTNFSKCINLAVNQKVFKDIIKPHSIITLIIEDLK